MRFLKKIFSKIKAFLKDENGPINEETMWNLELADEPWPDLPIELMTKESLIQNGVSEAKAEFMCAVADGTIDGSCLVPSDIKSNCAVCNKELNYNDSYCDYCERPFCSDECAQLDDYENTFRNCCPGVYWCIVCRNNYLSKAGGHLFIIRSHPPHPDLKTYLDADPNEWIFVDRCMNCEMWHYEFKSQVDNVPGKYEGQVCGVKIRDKND